MIKKMSTLIYLNKVADDFVAILWLKSVPILEVQTI